MIPIRAFKYLMMFIGVVMIWEGLDEKNWDLVRNGIGMTIILGFFGYGVECLAFRLRAWRQRRLK